MKQRLIVFFLMSMSLLAGLAIGEHQAYRHAAEYVFDREVADLMFQNQLFLVFAKGDTENFNKRYSAYLDRENDWLFRATASNEILKGKIEDFVNGIKQSESFGLMSESRERYHDFYKDPAAYYKARGADALKIEANKKSANKS